MLGVAVTAEVESDDVTPHCQTRRKVVPPVRIRSASVKEHELGIGGVAPVKRVQRDGACAPGRNEVQCL